MYICLQLLLSPDKTSFLFCLDKKGGNSVLIPNTWSKEKACCVILTEKVITY